MLHNIRLAAEFAAKPAEIYAMYLDAKSHADITAAPSAIGAHEGGDFSAFGGSLTGRILHLVKGKRIVQTWRSDAFKKGDLDSILVLNLSALGANQTLLDLEHINVPLQDYAGISHGWETYYFAPWREYLAERAAREALRKPPGKQNSRRKTT